jgi:hypothetical protein
MRDDDTHIEIDGGEVVDIASDATTPEALRRAAAYLRRQSEKPLDLRFGRSASPEETKPEPPSLETLVGYGRVDDPTFDEEADRVRRGRAEIEIALMKEQQEVEQQRRQTQADVRAKARQTSLGRLLGVRYGR